MAAEESARAAIAADHAARAAIAAGPGQGPAYYRLGLALAGAGRLAAAAWAFARASRLDPADAAALHNLGAVAQVLGRTDQAIRAFEATLALRPDSLPTHHNLARLLLVRDRPAEAEASLRVVLAGHPDDLESRTRLGLALKRQDRGDEAAAAFAAVLAARPEDAEARLGHCMAALPMLFERPQQLAAARARYRARLEDCAAALRLDSPAAVAAAAAAIGSFQPYFLAYQGQCDRALQEIYGDLVCRVMAARYPHWAEPPPAPPVDGPIRVGVVSGHFRWHTVWKLFLRGWAQGLDRRRLRLTGYATNADPQPESGRGFERLVSGLDFEALAGTIRADRPHLLLYPEIGMDPTCARLAALRLAPRQWVAWGHPDTTGLPTIDAFLSSDLMEPEGAEAHYRERLLRLPNLGIAYSEPPPPARKDASAAADDFGFDPGDVVYLCCQHPSKYLPQHDVLLARIAAAVPRARFAFIGGHLPQLAARLRRRLAEAFAAHGRADGRQLVFLPYLDPERYAALNRRAQVYLDSIDWSGGNTTLEAVAAGLPVVTLPGALMRGRHSAAILTMAGLNHTIARDADDYVARAVALGRDGGLRADLAAATGAGMARITADQAPLRRLEELIEAAVGGA